MELEFLNDIVHLFGLAIIVVLISHKFKIPTIVGLLLTGLLCGPSALGVIANHEAVDLMAEIGVALLLFTIGMELSAKELLRMRRFLIVGGGGQVLFTVLFMGICFSFFFGLNLAIVYGCLMALSSTAIVLSIFQKNAQTESPQGRASLGILIFQDLIIVPMMLIFPLLVGNIHMSMSHTLISLAKNIAVITGIVLFGKFILPRLMLSVVRTRSREIMLMTTLGLCLAIALLTASVGLSLSLGAFLAGLLLAESEYSLDAMENVLPFKDIFTSIFFISVGMLLNLNFFFTHLISIILFAIFIVLTKVAIIVPVACMAGLSLRTAIITGFSLAQVGEFSFVLANSAMNLGLLGHNGYQNFLAASIFTMVCTPVFMSYSPKIAEFLIKKFAKNINLNPESQEEHNQLHGHIIIVGFGVGGKNLARVAKESSIPYIISEMNPDTVKRYKKTEPIRHGDASYPLVLEHLNVQTARVLAIMVPDPVGSRAIISHAKKLNPSLHIIVRARFLSDMDPLFAQGASEVIPEEFETSVEIFARVLNHYLIPRQEIDKQIAQVREENYKSHDNFTMLRSVTLENEYPNDIHKSLPNLQFISYRIEKNAPLDGQTLSMGTLRNSDVNLAGIRRGEETIIKLHSSTKLLADDVLFLFGPQDSLINANFLFIAPD